MLFFHRISSSDLKKKRTLLSPKYALLGMKDKTYKLIN